MRYVRFRYRRHALHLLARDQPGARASASSASMIAATPALASRAASASRRWRKPRSSRCRIGGVRLRGVEGREAARRLLRLRRGRLLQRPAHPPAQEAADQDHREPGRDLPESRAPGDPSAQPARKGRRIKIDAHFPPASQAYYEATPQKLLSQSRFIHPELNRVVRGAVQCGCLRQHLRRCQGFVRTLHQRDQPQRPRDSPASASPRRSPPCAATTAIRVPYFQASARSGAQSRPSARGRPRDRAPARQSHAALRRRRRCRPPTMPFRPTTQPRRAWIYEYRNRQKPDGRDETARHARRLRSNASPMPPAINPATASSSIRCCRPRPIIGRSAKPATASRPPSSPCARRSRTSTSPPVARSARRRSRNSTACSGCTMPARCC